MTSRPQRTRQHSEQIGEIVGVEDVDEAADLREIAVLDELQHLPQLAGVAVVHRPHRRHFVGVLRIRLVDLIRFRALVHHRSSSGRVRRATGPVITPRTRQLYSRW